MKRFKKFSWLFIIACVLLGLFLPGYTKLQDLRDRNRQLQENIGKIKAENIVLQDQLQRLQNEPLYQEKVAREKMGVVRKGEVLYKIETEKEE